MNGYTTHMTSEPWVPYYEDPESGNYVEGAGLCGGYHMLFEAHRNGDEDLTARPFGERRAALEALPADQRQHRAHLGAVVHPPLDVLLAAVLLVGPAGDDVLLGGERR